MTQENRKAPDAANTRGFIKKTDSGNHYTSYFNKLAPSSTEVCVRFREAIFEGVGYAPTVIKSSGKLERFSCNGKSGDKSGWYILRHMGNYAVGVFGDWRTGIKNKWHSNRCQKIGQQDWSHIQQVIAAEKTKAAARQQAKIRRANQIWQSAKTVNLEHPYLRNKQVCAYGLRQSGQALIIPLRNEEGRLQGIQYVYPNGVKRIFGSLKGGFHHIGRVITPFATIYVSEGYATGASIHAVTGSPVVIALSTSNLVSVGNVIRRKYPKADLIFAADNDMGSKSGKIENPGIHWARVAAQACYGRVIIPNTQYKADYNDLLRGVVA